MSASFDPCSTAVHLRPRERVPCGIRTERCESPTPPDERERSSLPLATAGLVAAGLFTATASTAAPTHARQSLSITSTGLKAGQIKHVWLIILENKSYDATFTGLNQNSYLWKTLPEAGRAAEELLRHRALQPGQLPVHGVRAGAGGGHAVRLQRQGLRLRQQRTHRHVGQEPRPGRLDRRTRAQPSGANAPNGTNGCTYPTDAPTLFNQLDAAGKTWKGYAQDLGNQPGREDAVCGGPGTAANNPTTNPTVMTATAANPLPGRGDELHRCAGERPVRREALPVPVVPQHHRDRHAGRRRRRPA